MRKMLVVLMLVLPMGLCKAQSTTAKPVEPTAIGVVYRLDPTTQELKKLPDEEWNEKTHGLDLSNVVAGERSSERVKASERIEFVFKVGVPEYVTLYKFTQKDNKRQYQVKKTALMTGTNTYQKGLSVVITQFGTSSYKLAPASPLTPGEYAINIADEVYTFGVD